MTTQEQPLTPSQQPQRTVSIELLLGVGIALGILLRIINLSSREFWYDEVLSLLLSTGKKIAYIKPKDFPISLEQYSQLLTLPLESNFNDIIKTITNLLKGIVQGEPHPPLFYISHHLWLRIFGNSVAAIRSLVALFSIAAIGCAYGLGRKLLGHRGGLLLAALLSLNPYYLFHSLNVRMYGSLVFWTILSIWALLEVLNLQQDEDRARFSSHRIILWHFLLIIAVIGGWMTFYLFAYWLMTLFIITLYLDRRHWWQNGLRLATGVFLTLPWMVWGTRQQLRNADSARFETPGDFFSGLFLHIQDVLNTLGTQLVLGDWVTSLSSPSILVIGCIVAVIWLGFMVDLSKRNISSSFVYLQSGSLLVKRPIWVIAAILGLLPLGLGFILDIISDKSTLYFGWGRSVITALPGCLLLLTIWIEQSKKGFQQVIACILLLLYLSINVGDLTLRQRQMFHQVAEVIETNTPTPTLVVMNSRAWGHLMRLAYYIPPEIPVQVLAVEAAQLTPSLTKVLSQNQLPYQQIVWLDMKRPIWSPATTEDEKKAVQNLLQARFHLQKTQSLRGTMTLDDFMLYLYK